MWVESILIRGDQIMDAAELDGWQLSVGACDPAASRMLLAQVTVPLVTVNTWPLAQLVRLALFVPPWLKESGVVRPLREVMSELAPLAAALKALRAAEAVVAPVPP